LVDDRLTIVRYDNVQVSLRAMKRRNARPLDRGLLELDR
jgi:hypothetical protein